MIFHLGVSWSDALHCMDCTVSLAPFCIESRHMFCYITLYHIASYWFAFNHILHHIMLCLTMHRIAWFLCCSVWRYYIALYRIISRRIECITLSFIVSHHFVSRGLTSSCVASYRIAPYCMEPFASYIVSHRILLYHIVSYHIEALH